MPNTDRFFFLRNLFRIFIFAAIFLFVCIVYVHPDSHAYQILEESSIIGSAERVIYRADMEIFSSRGSKSRKIEIFKEESGDNTYKLLAQVVFPTFLRDMKLLIISENSQESRWMKTSRGVRSIADSGRTEQIFDSDLDTDDLTNINPDNFNVSLHEKNEDYYIIHAVETNTGNKRKITICRQMNIITDIIYYNESGSIYKKYELLDSILIDGEIFPKESVVKRPANNTYTVLTFTSIELPDAIPARTFNRHQL